MKELTNNQKREIEVICYQMVELIDKETLEDILMEPYDSEEGVLGNDAFFESEELVDCDYELIGAYAHYYLSRLV